MRCRVIRRHTNPPGVIIAKPGTVAGQRIREALWVPRSPGLSRRTQRIRSVRERIRRKRRESEKRTLRSCFRKPLAKPALVYHQNFLEARNDCSENAWARSVSVDQLTINRIRKR